MKKHFSPKGEKKKEMQVFCCVYLEKVTVVCGKVHKDIQNVMFSSWQVCVVCCWGSRGF